MKYFSILFLLLFPLGIIAQPTATPAENVMNSLEQKESLAQNSLVQKSVGQEPVVQESRSSEPGEPAIPQQAASAPMIFNGRASGITVRITGLDINHGVNEITWL